MDHFQPRQYSAEAFRFADNTGSIEWEELPWLVDSIRSTLAARGTRRQNESGKGRAEVASYDQSSIDFALAWDTTVASSFDTICESPPFSEPLAGLSTREVYEPDVLRHFFRASHPRR